MPKQKFNFSRHATATTWNIHLFHEDRDFAESIANESFRKIEKLEADLSRFKTGSDIMRINRMEVDETITISQETYDCLREAMVFAALTNGGFDPGLGTVMDMIRTSQGTFPEAFVSGVSDPGQLLIHEDKPAVTCLSEGINIDLGGIGKGFIIDHIVSFIQEEHGIECGMVDGGGSSIYAWHNGETTWKFRLGNENDLRRIDLNGFSISCSSFSEKGAHIINPITKQFAPLEKQVWTFAPCATWADALSTAFMVLNEEETKRCCDENTDLQIGCLIETKKNAKKLKAFGWLPNFDK